MQIELKSPQEKAEETYAIGDVLLVGQAGCQSEVVMLCGFGGRLYVHCLRNGNHYSTNSPELSTSKGILDRGTVEYAIGAASTIIRKLNVKLVEV